MIKTSFVQELSALLKEAITKAILGKYADKSVRILGFTLEVEDLNPTGWSLSLRMNAQLSPLSKKTEEKEETPE